jgi:hypothetical protein
VKYLFIEYQFISKIIAYVRNEGTNLNTFAFTFTCFVSYALLQLVAPFSGHVMSKACQYAINDTKIGVGMKETNNRCPKWLGKNHYISTKKLGKGRQEWESMCKETG